MSENIGIVDSTHLLRRLPVSYPCIGEECLCSQFLVCRLLFVRILVHCDHIQV